MSSSWTYSEEEKLIAKGHASTFRRPVYQSAKVSKVEQLFFIYMKLLILRELRSSPLDKKSGGKVLSLGSLHKARFRARFNSARPLQYEALRSHPPLSRL